MAADALSAPLTPLRGKFAWRSETFKQIAVYAAVAAVFCAAGAAIWVMLESDGLGGEPHVELALNKQPPPVSSDMHGSNVHGQPQDEALPMRNTLQPDGPLPEGDVRITRITPVGEAGRIREGELPPAGGRAIVRRVGDHGNAPLRRAPDPALVERSKAGPLPRIGKDGRRPSDVYSRPYRRQAVLGGNEPARIAIMIGGLGISVSGTGDAIKKLPPDISLAFAPYGRDLQSWVNKARQAGHEVLLQLPMEPFDYPDNDPGPHTLLTENKPNENLQRLHWLMSRFTGYFGATNYMGAKFTAAQDSLSPVLREIAERGLAYIDDGSSARSVAAEAGAADNLRTAVADIVVDLGQTRPAIDEALKKLEAMAQERGFALATGTAFPVTVDMLEDWAKDLENRGFVLVPVSAALAYQPRS